MARRISRRPRVVWLPNTLEFAVGPDANQSTYGTVIHDLVAPIAGDAVVSTHALVNDAPADPLLLTNTLADIEQSSYRLRRIVGKIWVGCRQSVAGPFGPTTVIATAGFIVLRVDANGAPLAGTPQPYGPNIIDTDDSPWIWRRSWIVADRASDVSGAFLSGVLGSTNAYIGGVADGPHVDAKTARIVGHDERLFLVLSSTALIAGSEGIITQLRWVWDPRVLVSMRTTSGNRRNASR